ncbi:MAG: isoaspartyl peptidase/L-asparaginase, partial [Candidatus Aminicenantes bacterium]|nr:isoaspartyl peptidase/L-asparaginase [Candidatus Aminicenantes bacterium]
MSLKKFSRRDFMSGMAGLGVSLPLIGKTKLSAIGDENRFNRPLVVTSKTNPYVKEELTTKAWDILKKGGRPIDAAVQATNISEISPLDTTVGYGGSPNEEGYLQLDASVMSGPDDNNAGAVAALENIKTPSSIAQLVMER